MRCSALHSWWTRPTDGVNIRVNNWNIEFVWIFVDLARDTVFLIYFSFCFVCKIKPACFCSGTTPRRALAQFFLTNRFGLFCRETRLIWIFVLLKLIFFYSFLCFSFDICSKCQWTCLILNTPVIPQAETVCQSRTTVTLIESGETISFENDTNSVLHLLDSSMRNQN